MPLDKIKIDQSFVQNIQTDTPGHAITDAIIALGRTLGLEIVAEGIESEEDLTYLRDQGCHQAQGFYLCKPLSEDGFAIWYRHYLPGRLSEPLSKNPLKKVPIFAFSMLKIAIRKY